HACNKGRPKRSKHPSAREHSCGNNSSSRLAPFSHGIDIHTANCGYGQGPDNSAPKSQRVSSRYSSYNIDYQYHFEKNRDHVTQAKAGANEPCPLCCVVKPDEVVDGCNVIHF